MASSLYVTIRGDYSKFQEDLTRARGIARQNGTAISNALNNAISPQQAIQGITKLTSAIKNAQAQLASRSFSRPTIEGINDLAAAANMSASKIDDLMHRMQNTAAANNLRRAFSDIQQQTGMTNLQMARLRASMGDISGAMGQLAGMAKTAGLAIAAIGTAAIAAGKSLTDNAVQLDQLDKAFGAIMGDSDGAAKQLDYIRGVSNKLGLEYLSTAKAAKTFFAASKGTTLEKDMNRIFEAVSKAGTAMSLSAQDMEGVFLALGQMVSKGKVQAEELRGQLGERLPGAFRMAADAMGMTTAELDKFMADGKLTAEDLLPRLADVMEGRFARAAEAASGGVQQAINRMSSAWTEFKANVTNNEAILSSINAITGALNGVNSMFKQVSAQEQAFKKVTALQEQIAGVEKAKSAKSSASLFDLSTWAAGMGRSEAELDAELKQLNAKLVSAQEDLAKENKRIWSEAERDRLAEEARARAQARRIQEESSKASAEKSTAEFLKNSEVAKKAKIRSEYDATVKAVNDRMRILEESGRRETEEYKNLVQKKLAIDAEYKRQMDAQTNRFAPKGTKKAKGQTAEEVIAELERKADLNAPKEEARARKEKIQDMQNEANLLKMLAEVSGNYSMSQEAQRLLIDAQTASLKEQNRNLIESKPQIEAYIDEWSRLAHLANSADALDRMRSAWVQFSNEAGAVGKHLGDTLKSATDSVADAFATFCTEGKFKFKDLANSILSDLARIAAKQATSQIGNALMASFGLMASASGNVFSGGDLSSYSNTVVTKPTVFGYGRHLSKYANGAGLMGEAGPEAIMPLRRTASGRLGVEASGGSNVEVKVINNTSEKATVKQGQTSSGGKSIEVIIGDIVAKQMSTQGSKLNRAVMSQTGGAQPVVRR